jgi:hypothetical protein
MKVVGFGCGPWRWYRGVGEIHMNKGRVGEERGGKEMDGCPLTSSKKSGALQSFVPGSQMWPVKLVDYSRNILDHSS